MCNKLACKSDTDGMKERKEIKKKEVSVDFLDATVCEESKVTE